MSKYTCRKPVDAIIKQCSNLNQSLTEKLLVIEFSLIGSQQFILRSIAQFVLG